jgi:uncharacterized delta-60 repeat protein
MLIPLGILAAAAAGGPGYWLATIGGSAFDGGRDVAIDADGNIYSVGITQSAGSGQQDFLLVKQDPAGAIVWQRTFGLSDDEQGISIGIDSSDNVYIYGTVLRVAFVAASRMILAKFNSSGTIQWQRQAGGGGNDFPGKLAIASTGDVYFSGATTAFGAGAIDAYVAKFNSSGTVQWQRAIGSTSSERANGIAVDSAGDVYLVGLNQQTYDGGLLVKLNSAGTNQWQRKIGNFGQPTTTLLAAVADSSNNVYTVGNTFITPTEGFFLAKYNSSGTQQWQRFLSGAGNESCENISIDGAGNIYLFGRTSSSGAGSNDFMLAKYDTNGTIQWQRTLGGTGNDQAFGGAIDADGNLYAIGQTAALASGEVLIAKLPSDGSLTGTYNLAGYSISYAASSLSDTGGSAGVNIVSQTVTTGSIVGTPSYVVTTPTLSSALTNL